MKRARPLSQLIPPTQDVTTNHTTSTLLTDVPIYLLESFLPGFGVISRLLVTWLGFDITALVSACFLAVALAGALRYVWRPIYELWTYWFTSSISIESTDKLFEEVMQWISTHEITRTSRSLTAKSSKEAAVTMTDQWSGQAQSTTYNFGAMEARNPPVYAPSYGKHRFWHEGRYFIFSREQHNQASLDGIIRQARQGVPAAERETVRLTCFGRSPRPIQQLLMQCKDLSATKNKSTTTVRRPHAHASGHWRSAMTRPSRPMDTVYMDDSKKAELLQDVREFLDPTAPRFYARRGIPYRRGYLFYGPPGTGKTSLSFALAGAFGFELYVISLREPLMTEQRLADLFSGLPARCIVLLEDIDTAGLDKRNDDNNDALNMTSGKADEAATSRHIARQLRGVSAPGTGNEGISLSGLLNAIDGVASQEGRILVMTTNHPESLDQALIRPGRVDMQVHFGHASKEQTHQIFVRMFSKDPEEDSLASTVTNVGTDIAKSGLEREAALIEHEVPELLDMASKFADTLPEMTFTPAEVQGFLLTRRRSPYQALDDTPAWRDQLLTAKAAGKNVIAPPTGSPMPAVPVE